MTQPPNQEWTPGQPGGQGQWSPGQPWGQAPQPGAPQYGGPYQSGPQQGGPQQWQPAPPQGQWAPQGASQVPQPAGAKAGGPIAPLLMLAGAGLCLVSTILPWYKGLTFSSSSGGLRIGRENWNGWRWAMQGVNNGKALGYLLLFAILLAMLGVVLTGLSAVLRLTGSKPTGLTWAGVVIGLVATLGTVITIIGLASSGGGSFRGLGMGIWVFGVSFVIAAIGAAMTRGKA